MNLECLLSHRALASSGKDVEKFNGGIDFIGDVHGCFKTLVALLEKLGYQEQAGCYRYVDQTSPRKVIFVGDLVDRGPGIREVLHIVHAMVEHGEAQLVLGNHEFYACAYFIPTRENANKYIRPHTPKNYDLLEETILAFKDYEDEARYFFKDWMITRPIFIEHDQYRVIHACWDDLMIAEYINRYKKNTIELEFILDFSNTSSFSYQFLERCLRGIELNLPDDVFIRGTDGTLRDNFRARFWLEAPQTYDEVIFRRYMLPEEMVGVKLSQNQLDDLCCYSESERPLFVGHYWQSGEPKPLTNNIACVDYSAVRGGQLMAYRFDGETKLAPKNFLSVACQDDVPFMPEKR